MKKPDILVEVEKNTKDIANINSHMQQINDNANLLKDDKRAKIGVAALWSANTWDTGLTTMKSQIDTWVSNGVEEISYIINIQYINNEFVIYGNQDNALEALQYAISKGLIIKCLKVHGANDEANVTSYGLENFKTRWKYLLNEIHNKFSLLNIEYFVVLNEKEYMYENTTNYENFILECISQMKDYGYKVGVSTASTYYSVVKISELIKNAVDCFFINQYPSLSFKGNRATLDDCKSGWNSQFLLSSIENIKSYGKEIILSESGVRNYYEYLASPSKYTWDSNTGITPSVNGEVGILYLGSLLKSEYIKYFSRLWLWYPDTFMKPDVKVYIDKYKGGVL